MRQKKTPVHFLCCNSAMQSLSTMMVSMEQMEFQVSLMLPNEGAATSMKTLTMKQKEMIVELSESLGGSHIDLEKVVELWDSIKEHYYTNINPSNQEEPTSFDVCFATADDAISMVLNFMER